MESGQHQFCHPLLPMIPTSCQPAEIWGTNLPFWSEFLCTSSPCCLLHCLSLQTSCTSSFLLLYLIKTILRKESINTAFPRGITLKQQCTVGDDEDHDHNDSNRIFYGCFCACLCWVFPCTFLNLKLFISLPYWRFTPKDPTLQTTSIPEVFKSKSC